ncbi:MAG: hypothetical protein MJ060_02890 [Clostridia bacterium]|nr:hypothetical protein [Clostridia bacterium]
MYFEEAIKQRTKALTVDKATQRQRVISVLYKAFAIDGSFPVRHNEPYLVRLNNGIMPFTFVNCVGHALNLTNEQFNDYQIEPYHLFGNFPGIRQDTNEQAVQRITDFFREIGLEVKECDPKKRITDFKSWKVAFYFKDDPYNKDCHVMLEEDYQFWSCKNGFTPVVEHMVTDGAPEKIWKNKVESKPAAYLFHGTWELTNPKADGNNIYAKKSLLNGNFNVRNLRTPCHYIAEGSRSAFEDYCGYCR